MIIIPGAGHLLAHQQHKSIAVPHPRKVRHGVARRRHFVLREVDTLAVFPIRPDIAENVGDLQGVAEIDSIFPALGVLAAEDADADQTDTARHAITIKLELLPGAVAARLDIHGHAINDLEQLSRRDLIAIPQFQQVVLKRLQVRRAAAHDHPPTLQCFQPLRCGPAFIIRDVVHHPAESIKNIHVAATALRQAGEGEGKVRPASLDDLERSFAGRGGGHRLQLRGRRGRWGDGVSTRRKPTHAPRLITVHPIWPIACNVASPILRASGFAAIARSMPCPKRCHE